MPKTSKTSEDKKPAEKVEKSDSSGNKTNTEYIKLKSSKFIVH